MTAHPQSTPRGTWTKKRFDVGAQQLTDGVTYLNLNNGIRISGLAGGLLTADASQVILPGGVKISNAAGGALTANANATVFPLAIQLTATSADPSARVGPGAVKFESNSTGAMLALNTTGTTWKYLNVTSVLA
jgi:hypothetical protein